MIEALRVDLDPELHAVVRPVALVVSPVHVAAASPALATPLAAAAATARAAGETRAAVTTAVRTMYKRVGIDPTRTRPSSEALLRRVRKGQPLPRINDGVDVINWTSLETQLPFGLYDRDRIEGGVELRLGREGEEYAGIRKDVVHLAGRLALADARGAFGNPTSDSARTMVTGETTTLLVVVFAPVDVAAGAGDGACRLAAERLQQFCGR